jgi:hypothetical protein
MNARSFCSGGGGQHPDEFAAGVANLGGDHGVGGPVQAHIVVGHRSQECSFNLCQKAEILARFWQTG